LVEPWRINNKGQIVGRDFGSAKYSLFLYDPQAGYQSLLQGKLHPSRYGLEAMNNHGVIIASSQIVKGVSRPIRYTPGRGWEDLINTVPALNRFNKNPFSVYGTPLNDNGDFTFYRWENGELHAYVYYEKSGKAVDLAPMIQVGDVNDFGWVAGNFYKLTEGAVIEPINQHPYVYIPGTGIQNIRPNVKDQSFAGWISTDGTVGGCIIKELNCETIFTYNKQEGSKIVNAELFRKMLPPDMPYDGVDVHSMNDRKEFVGGISTHDDHPESQHDAAFFWYSPRHGLMDLQKIVSQLNKNVKIQQIEDFNNAGQILLIIEGVGNYDAVILTPKN
jgi:hypothetical protein